ncbi:MAG TPA: penicillin-binding protein 2 [Planctomycetota bacterium]|nr:penicillin-binding protein 2 [Planctomycetota bacterium]
MTPVIPVEAQPWRVGFACVVFAGLFALVAYRLHHLQVVEYEALSDRGRNQRVHTVTLHAPRGNVYDGAGVPLAVCVGSWSIYADPGYMDDRMRATVELSRVLGIDRDTLREHFAARSNGRRIARHIDDRRADAVRALKLTGIAVRREYTRLYPEGNLAPHVLGFVLADGKGGAGIEQQFERVLAGVPGRETLAVDALGVPSLVDSDSVPARPGAHVQLTIDTTIQGLLERALAAAVVKHRPLNAAGIVIRPSTGEILAMASWPDFDARDLSRLEPAAMRNNALSFVYEPGSTMKPLVAGAAVAERLTSWNETIHCEDGRWTWRSGKYARTVTDHSVKHGGHQGLSVTKIIALSDNIGMAKLGLRMGPERLHHWITSFGFGSRPGLCLPGEDAGLMQPKDRWNMRDSCISVPMGHEIAVTPLQMALAHAAIANGGTWLPPRLVKRVWQYDPQSGGERDLETPRLPAPRRMFEPGDAARIQEAMTHTMTEGTGKNADLDGYTAAGKTGTTEKLVGGRYSKSNHIGSFVCWAPAEPGTDPELLALVTIDDPRQGGHYGSETAAPVVQAVLQGALEHLGVPKRQELTKEVKDEQAAAAARAQARRGRRP